MLSAKMSSSTSYGSQPATCVTVLCFLAHSHISDPLHSREGSQLYPIKQLAKLQLYHHSGGSQPFFQPTLTDFPGLTAASFESLSCLRQQPTLAKHRLHLGSDTPTAPVPPPLFPLPTSTPRGGGGTVLIHLGSSPFDPPPPNFTAATLGSDPSSGALQPQAVLT
jgi:hypothetical protein